MNNTESQEKPAAGFTLIELMISVALFTTILGVIFLLFTNLVASVNVMESQALVRDDQREAMRFMTRKLRMAESVSIMGVRQDSTVVPLSATPVPGLQFRIAQDLDGNGNALDVDKKLETSTLITWRILTPTDDPSVIVNGPRRLVEVDDAGNIVRSIAQTLSPDIDAAGTMYDVSNGGGVGFTRVGSSIGVVLISRRPASTAGSDTVMRMDRLVTPLN